MTPSRRTYLLLILAVVVVGAVTGVLGPRGCPQACGVSRVTMAVEVCDPAEVKPLLGDIGSDVRRTLCRQTLLDFAFIASYVGLWGATGLAIHPVVAAIAVAAGAADVVENAGILTELPLSDPLPMVMWAGRTKWGLLGVAFIAFALVFRPHAVGARPAALLRAATGLAYVLAGIGCVVGVRHPAAIQWGAGAAAVALALQFLLHAFAHPEFLRFARAAKSAGAGSPCLALDQVLRSEFEHLHGPIPAGTGPGLAGLFESIHGLADKRAALCLSGGGIRSATFALGVMQGLAHSKLLPRFHYLSTVSGGGYIGSWLTAWIHRAKDDVAAVADGLGTVRTASRLDPEPAQVSHLRDYSNYLAPRPGLLSADSWTLFGTILRNLILVWLVLLPLLAAALVVPRVYVSLLAAAPAAPPRWVACTLLGLGAALLAWAVAYIGASIPNSTTALRSQGRYLALCLAPQLMSVVCLTLYWAWWPVDSWKALVGFGMVVHLVAWAGYTAWLRTPWGRGRRADTWWHGAVAALAELAVVLVVGAVGGWIAWRIATLPVFFPPRHLILLYACLAPGVFVGTFLLAATLLIGFLSRWTEDEDREWWARCGAWMLIAGNGWIVVSALVVFGPLLFSHAFTTSVLASAGGVSGLITLVGGWTARSTAGTASNAVPGPAAKLGNLLLSAAAPVFAAVIIISLSMLTSGVLGWLSTLAECAMLGRPIAQWPALPKTPFGHESVLLTSSPWLVVAVGVGLGVAGGVAATLVNTNKFSLHAMYRNRLIRAYLGASNPDRHGNPFTGFDETDNVQMHELWPNPRPATTPEPAPERRPLFHVVNLALNLVQGDRLAWQERKAHSFTVTPLHAGSVAAAEGGGYRLIRPPGGNPRRRYGGAHGISLGTAMTISGAAASPNMGYHSSPLVTFLMTLFNARLGWWLGNPGPEGADTYYLSSPRFAVSPILAEAFGLTSRTAPYVYLSDGGHFENLGLYEMVLRRCHFIVVSDAGCDDKCQFNDLGGAIRKIRADFGIPIDFPRGIAIYSRSADAALRAKGLYWALGRIRYSEVDPPAPHADPEAARAAVEARDGWLLYIKAAFYGTEPPDVFEYAMANPLFPHEPTVDQFFSESQFESYRMLGLHAVRKLQEGWTGTTFAGLVQHANRPSMAARPSSGD